MPDSSSICLLIKHLMCMYSTGNLKRNLLWKLMVALGNPCEEGPMELTKPVCSTKESYSSLTHWNQWVYSGIIYLDCTLLHTSIWAGNWTQSRVVQTKNNLALSILFSGIFMKVQLVVWRASVRDQEVCCPSGGKFCRWFRNFSPISVVSGGRGILTLKVT